ncbi:Transcriptional regulator, contains XRE-family HTH domain [Variovorax sp. YR752]|uniref:helix-turn-helix domain-containing protein n=1 Tax=Variovorax sp. YR752 TaxID=1884383 RepID=UPI000BD85F29|nr:helix-turn-helix transcriptional regulator [Variovorax sp. YR752]SOD29444.1 Transcriptional regulator, contains XRE-family HTH domain [Variovorax sp. YR752]
MWPWPEINTIEFTSVARCFLPPPSLGLPLPASCGLFHGSHPWSPDSAPRRGRAAQGERHPKASPPARPSFGPSWSTCAGRPRSGCPCRHCCVHRRAGWSQVQLAEEVGVSQSSIRNIESGFRQRPRELVSIARALRVSPEWLETGKGPKTERSPLKLVGADAEPSVRALVEYLAEIAAQQRPTLRKNLANLLVDLVEHPEDTALIEQTIADIERFFSPPHK